jgi:hypothetical protein
VPGVPASAGSAEETYDVQRLPGAQLLQSLRQQNENQEGVPGLQILRKGTRGLSLCACVYAYQEFD